MLFLRVCCVLYQCNLTVNTMHFFLLHLSMDFHVLFNVSLQQCLSLYWLNSLMASFLCHLQGSSVISPEYYPSWFNLHHVSSSLIKKPLKRCSIFPEDLFWARRNTKELDVEAGNCWGWLQRKKENFWANRGFKSHYRILV